MQHPFGCFDVDLTVAPNHRVQHETVDHRHDASRDVPCQPGSHQLIDVTISPLEERLAKRRLARCEQGQLVPRVRKGAVAAGLQRAGATVTVRERQPDATQNGSGLSLFRNGLAALEALGLADAVRAAAGRSPEYASGLRLPSGRWMSRFSGQAISDLRIIERQRLHDVLHSQLRPGTVHFSSPVSNDERSSSTGGGHGDADLVVAADGIRSSLRAGWPDDPGARYAGYFAFRAITAEPVPLDASGGDLGCGPPVRRWAAARWSGVLVRHGERLP